MADLAGYTPVSAPLSPGADERNTWPTHDNRFGRGGIRFVADEAERNAIPIERRHGLVVIVESFGADGEKRAFKWNSKTADSQTGSWEDYELGTQDIPATGLTFVNPDGSTTTGINLLALKNLTLVGNPTDGYTLVAKEAGGESFKVGPNLEYQDDGAGGKVLSIKPMTFELRKAPGYLAYMQYPEFIFGKEKDGEKYRKGAIWPDMTRVSPEGMLQIDRNAKAIGLQETDGKDPNITGGSKFLVWPFIYLEGNAPVDGYVELLFVKKSDNSIAIDINGHPMAVRHNYKAGDELTPKHSPLMFAQVINAKGLEDYQLVLVDSFDEYVKILDYSEGPSGICIQELSKDGTTSNALVQAEADTGFSILVESYYLGTYLASIGYLTGITESSQVAKAGSKANSIAGVELFAVSDTEFAINQGRIEVNSSAKATADFYIGLYLSEEQTRMIAGDGILANLALVDKDDGWNIGFFEYKGDWDKRPPLYSARNNGSITLNKGWTSFGSDFIPEDAVSGIHSHETPSITVPKNADRIMVAIYPAQVQQPCDLSLKMFHLDANTPSEKFSVNDISIKGLQHLDFMTNTVRLEQGIFNKGVDGKVYNRFLSLRYTDGAASGGLPMPLGTPTGNLEYLTLDSSLNTINGSQAEGGEGALVASERVEVTIWQKWQLYNEKPDSHKAQYWLMVYRDSTGQATEVPNSRTTFTVDPNREGVDYFTTNKVTVTLEPGDYIYARSSSDIRDGAYAQSKQASKPLCITYVQEKYLG